jgi:hypothetical protein
MRGDLDKAGAPRLGRQGGDRHTKLRRLLSQAIRVRAGGQRDDLQAIGVRAHDIEGALPNRSRRAENRQSSQKLYLTKM